MSEPKRPVGMKSAYELALERLDREGIAQPSETAMDDETRKKIAEVRRQGAARLAELEILHGDRLKRIADADARGLAEEEYRRERARAEDLTETKVARLRAALR